MPWAVRPDADVAREHGRSPARGSSHEGREPGRADGVGLWGVGLAKFQTPLGRAEGAG